MLFLKRSPRPMGLFFSGSHSRQRMQKVMQFSYFQLQQTGIFSLISRVFIKFFCSWSHFLLASVLWLHCEAGLPVKTAHGCFYLTDFPSLYLCLPSWDSCSHPLKAARLLPPFSKFSELHAFVSIMSISIISISKTGNQMMQRQHLRSSVVTCLYTL